MGTVIHCDLICGCILPPPPKINITSIASTMVAPENSEGRRVWMLGPSQNDIKSIVCTVESLYGVLDKTGDITVLVGEHDGKAVLGLVSRNGTAAVNEWNPAYRGVICVVSQEANVDVTEAEATAIVATFKAGMTIHVYHSDIRQPAQNIMVPTAMSVREICMGFCGFAAGAEGNSTEYATVLGKEPTSGMTLVMMGRTMGEESEKNGWVEGLYGPLVVCKGEKRDGELVLVEAPEAVVRAYMAWILTKTPLAD